MVKDCQQCAHPACPRRYRDVKVGNDYATVNDGKWGTMTKAVWLAFGSCDMPPGLCQKFARKCRELLQLYNYGLDGPFAQHCQKKMNRHRGAFFDAHALKPWADGSEAARAKSVDGRKACRCTLKSVNAADETATAVSMNGEERAAFFSDLKAPKTLQCF